MGLVRSVQDRECALCTHKGDAWHRQWRSGPQQETEISLAPPGFSVVMKIGDGVGSVKWFREIQHFPLRNIICPTHLVRE